MNKLKTILILYILSWYSILDGQILSEGNLLIFFHSDVSADVILDYTINKYDKNIFTLSSVNKTSKVTPTSLTINNKGQDLNQIYSEGLFTIEIDPNILARNDSTLIISVTYKVDFAEGNIYMPVIFPSVKPVQANSNLFNVEVVPTDSELLIYPLFPKINPQRGAENNFEFSMRAVPSFLKFTTNPSSIRLIGLIDILVFVVVLILLIGFVFYIKSK